MNKNRVGLVLGVFFAILHAAWAILVLAGFAQGLLDWVLPLHFVSMTFSILTFNITNALILTVMAFVGGYITGWVYALIWNWIAKK